MKKLLLCLLLSGCATVETDFTVPPHLEAVRVVVKWSTPEEIRHHCGPMAIACATIAGPQSPYSAIRAVRPQGWHDERALCTLGHELMHSLGARH
jgi:hypothetical protein